jgi:hypothetical protein
MLHTIVLKPPPGVSVNQLADGSIRFHYTAETVQPFKKVLLQTAQNIIEAALTEVQRQKAAEIERQQLPITRMSAIDTELVKLAAQKEETTRQIAAIELAGESRA